MALIRPQLLREPLPCILSALFPWLSNSIYDQLRLCEWAAGLGYRGMEERVRDEQLTLFPIRLVERTAHVVPDLSVCCEQVNPHSSCSMVFHSMDKVTSLFIHLSPAMVTYQLRWFKRPDAYEICVNDECTWPFLSSMGYCLAFYMVR